MMRILDCALFSLLVLISAVVVCQCKIASEAVVAEKYYVGGLDECSDLTRVITHPTGYLITPPTSLSSYLGNCQWTITINAGSADRKLLIHFRNFSMGTGDTYTVSDAFFGGTFSVTYSSKSLPPASELEGLTDKVQIKFSSNDDGDVGTGVGFFWTSTFSEITTKANSLPTKTVFKSVVSGAEYTLTSPNYPGDYPTDITLYWAIQAPDGDRITIIFKDFELSLDDSLEIYEGLSTDPADMIVQYTGKQLTVPGPAVSSKSQLTVMFYSSPYVGKRGFSLLYKIYVPTKVTTTEESKTKKPITLNETGRAIVIVVCILASVLLAIVLVYFLYFKPKQRAEEQEIAREFFENEENMQLEHDQIPNRPKTVQEAARIQAEFLLRHNEANYGALSRRPGTARPGTASHRPGTAAALVNSGMAIERPRTVAKRNMNPNAVVSIKHEAEISYPPPGQTNSPLTSHRPNTASQRPASSVARPATASTRPKSGRKAEDTLSPRAVDTTTGDGKWNAALLDDDWGKPKMQISTTTSSAHYSAEPGLKPDPYQQTNQSSRLVPLANNLPTLSEPGQKPRKKKKKLKPQAAIEIDDNMGGKLGNLSNVQTSSRPKSGLRTSATAPGELFKEETSTLPGRVNPAETELSSRFDVGNLRPTSARQGYKAPKDLSDDELSL